MPSMDIQTKKEQIPMEDPLGWVNTQSDDGLDSVISELDRINNTTRLEEDSEDQIQQQEIGPKIKNLNTGETAYADWLRNKTPANMSRILDAYSPTINSEIMRYSGSKPLLRSKAKTLVIKAIKTFNPMSGAKLNSWIVTNLQPLARYSIQQRDIKIPEVAARQAAEVSKVTETLRDDLGRDPTDEEIADETGMSVKRIKDVRGKAVATITSSQYDGAEDDDMSYTPGVITPSKVPFAQEVVYHDLPDRDKFIFDHAIGAHGAKKMTAVEVAKKLGITPAAVSQRAKYIGNQIEFVVNNG